MGRTRRQAQGPRPRAPAPPTGDLHPPQRGGGQVKGGGPEGRSGQDGGADPERDERRRVRRRRRVRLKAALLGRSRGGQTSKVHLAADRKCRPLAFVLTAGRAADSPQFIPVLGKIQVRGPVGRPRTRPDAVAGDNAYSSRGNRATCAGAASRPSSRRKGTRPPTGRRRAAKGDAPSTPTPSFARRGHRRAPDQQAQGVAGHRDPLRQDRGKLPCRASAACLGDLDRRPHPNQSREPRRSSRGVACRDRSCGL
ncbi:transposase [Streptomyces sp. NPDC057291]|uniref:transposase n=1 Tax=Streptomyces sp. NPDC057291 TaxID=3346087 RepID=UPI0036444992